MKDKKKYHRGGNMPTPPGQVPHPPIGRRNAQQRRINQQRRLTINEQIREAQRRAQREAQRRSTNQRRQPMPMPIQQPRPIRGAVPVQATPQPMPAQRQLPLIRRPPLRPESTTVVPPSARRSTGTPKPKPRISPLEQAKKNSELLRRLAQGTIGRGRARRSTGTPKPSGRGRARGRNR